MPSTSFCRMTFVTFRSLSVEEGTSVCCRACSKCDLHFKTACCSFQVLLSCGPGGSNTTGIVDIANAHKLTDEPFCPAPSDRKKLYSSLKSCVPFILFTGNGKFAHGAFPGETHAVLYPPTDECITSFHERFASHTVSLVFLLSSRERFPPTVSLKSI